MILHIEQLQQLEELSLDVSHQECHLPEDIGKFTAPIHLDAQVRKVKEEITIEGRISTHLNMTCSRCLTRYDESIEDTFEVIYLPRFDTQEVVDEVELEEVDLNVSYYESETISLTELIREQLLLLLPVKPLCQDDCAGLCPSCGQNLNEGACTCSKETLDPRLSVLGQLLHQKTSET
jgi:uncharacterized protein